MQRMAENDLTCGIQCWVFVTYQQKMCPRHFSKVQCSNALVTEFDALGIWKFHALALQLLTAQIFISTSTSHLGLWGPDLSDGNCKVFHFSWAGLPWWEPISVFCHHYQRPLVLAGQSFLTPCWELCTCDGSAHCQIAYWSACDGRVHCLGQPVCYPAKVVCSLLLFHWDKSIFVQLCSRPSGSRPAATVDDCISATSHRPHIGCQFSVVMGFRLSPLVGVSLSCTGPTAAGQRLRQWDVDE